MSAMPNARMPMHRLSGEYDDRSNDSQAQKGMLLLSPHLYQGRRGGFFLHGAGSCFGRLGRRARAIARFGRIGERRFRGQGFRCGDGVKGLNLETRRRKARRTHAEAQRRRGAAMWRNGRDFQMRRLPSCRASPGKDENGDQSSGHRLHAGKGQ